MDVHNNHITQAGIQIHDLVGVRGPRLGFRRLLLRDPAGSRKINYVKQRTFKNVVLYKMESLQLDVTQT